MASSPAPEPDYQSLVLDYTRSPDQDAPAPQDTRSLSSAPGQWGSRPRSISPSRVFLSWCSMMTTGSPRDHAPSASRSALEIFDRLGCGQRMVDKGVTWNLGKVFFHDEPVYSFNLLPEAAHERPAFINLQQYYVEGYLLDRARELPNLEIRWKNKVVGLSQDGDGVELEVETPDGNYSLRCDWLVAADGARSPIRGCLGQKSTGQSFRDRFLIADVRMEAEFPTERWFWFDPPFHPNQSVLLHRQPDNVGASTSSSAGMPTRSPNGSPIG